jgi:nitroreductase
MSDDKEARPDHPIHDLMAQRWSPYVFDERSVKVDDLQSLLEAARWAASSYNEQPWRYILASLRFARNDKPNRAAEHDLGLASANLVLEATRRGLFVHQMIGILPDRARELYEIPEGFEALTALAIGRRGDPGNASEQLRERDQAPRSRRPLAEFVFSSTWGHSFESDGK